MLNDPGVSADFGSDFGEAFIVEGLFHTPTHQTTRMPSPSGASMPSSSGAYIPSPSRSYDMAITGMTESMSGVSMSHDFGGPSIQHAPDVRQRPHREIRPGPARQLPYTTQPPTTPLPERPRERDARVDTIVPMQDFAHTAERDGPRARKTRGDTPDVILQAKKGFPAVSNIQYLPGETLDPEWWKILVGKSQNKHYLNTHIEAWARMLATATGPEGRTWTIMYPDFIDELCTNKIAERGVLMAKGKLANMGWPAWGKTEKVIMTSMFDNHYWMVVVLHLDDMTLEFFDTDRGDTLHLPITMLYDHIKINLPSFLKKIGLKDQAKRAKSIRYNVVKTVPAIDHVYESGPQVCQILSALAAGQPPNRNSVDQHPHSFRSLMSTILWVVHE